MELPPEFNLYPKLKIIQEPTPVYELSGVGQWLGISGLQIKREDFTDTIYGGNKVRNLEFILGDAIRQGAQRLITVAPRGSNFAAALAAQAGKIGLPLELINFVPAQSELINAQAAFCLRHNARVTTVSGGHYMAPIKATLLGQRELYRDQHSYLISPGGSSALGVLGHIASAFELAGQIERGEVPEPDVLIVGAGTCGTMAGLIAGIKLRGLRTRVIGVRCVDKIVCNRPHVSYLANQALKLLNARIRVSITDVDLRDNGPVIYGSPLENSESLINQVRALSGIQLDTTYTSKVFSFLKSETDKGSFAGKKVLYWNTFSPAALLADARPNATVGTIFRSALSNIPRIRVNHPA